MSDKMVWSEEKNMQTTCLAVYNAYNTSHRKHRPTEFKNNKKHTSTKVLLNLKLSYDN